MNYSFHPQAEKELEESENYYDSKSKVLGDRFRSEIETTISRIIKFPQGWHPLSKVVRRCRLTAFPYGLIYRLKNDQIRILAVMHLHREPTYWADRK